MGRCVMRASKEEPRYGVFSSIVDNFVWVNGTRDDTLEYLVEDYRPGTDRYEFEKQQAEKCLDEADRRGTDSGIGRGAWDDEEILIMNNKRHGGDGRLPREHLGEFMRRIEVEADTSDLLLPFDWDNVDD